MKDSLSLAAMIRRFTREKEEMRKKNPSAAAAATAGTTTGLKPPNANRTVVNSNSVTPGNDLADLTNDPAVIPLLGSANDDMLQDLMEELDFSLLDPSELSSLEGQGENGNGAIQRAGGGASVGRVQRTGLLPPPPLPIGLPAPLTKRIEDLRAVRVHTHAHVTFINFSHFSYFNPPFLSDFCCLFFRMFLFLSYLSFYPYCKSLSLFFFMCLFMSIFLTYLAVTFFFIYL